MKEHYVYHIHRKSDKGNYAVGYIGVSVNPDKRFKQHHATNDCPALRKALHQYSDIVLTVIYKGTSRECYTMEFMLRPTQWIGWNIAVGGGSPPSWKGKYYRDETKAKITKSRIGKLNPNYGKTFSEETKAKLRKANVGRKRTPEQCKILSEINRENHRKRSSCNWVCEGVSYWSSYDAAKALKVSSVTIRNRCNNKNFPNYFREVLDGS